MSENPTMHVFTCCPKCGSNNVTLPNNFKDESIAICGDCGTELGAIGQLRETGRDMGRKLVREEFKSAIAKRTNK
jgi:ribosomal protein L34E